MERGRTDITTGMSMLASVTPARREGHVTALLRFFTFLWCYNRSKLGFDDSYVPIVDEQEYDWTRF
jgi:hypothetical protein